MKRKRENLITMLRQVKDYRRRQAKKHELALILIIVIMSIMSGYIGIRAFGDFIKRNEKDLIKYLKPNKKSSPQDKQ